MKILLVVFVLGFCLTGCATHRVYLLEIHDYAQAMNIAKENGADTEPMRKKLIAMVESYMAAPGEDPELKAQRQATAAMQWQAAASVYQVTKPEPYVPPMSPGEYFRGRR